MIIGSEMRRHSNRQRRWEMTGYAFDGASDDALASLGICPAWLQLERHRYRQQRTAGDFGEDDGVLRPQVSLFICNTGGAMRQYLIMRHSRPLLGCTDVGTVRNQRACNGRRIFVLLLILPAANRHARSYHIGARNKETGC